MTNRKLLITALAATSLTLGGMVGAHAQGVGAGMTGPGDAASSAKGAMKGDMKKSSATSPSGAASSRAEVKADTAAAKRAGSAPKGGQESVKDQNKGANK